MKRIFFEIELLSEVVVGARGSIVGGQAGLDYLPGSLFLGWAASRLYQQLSTDQAWQAFHSGALRFGDGLPLTRQRRQAYPVPRSWHTEKNGEFRNRERDGLCASKIQNHSQPTEPSSSTKAQPRQLRTGYVAPDGGWIEPPVNLRLKTAIRPETGTAMDSQLFGFQGILPETRFRFHLQADDDFDETLLESVAQSLDGPLRLGRSRGSEYGRVFSRRQPRQGADSRPAPQPLKNPKELCLWLLADLSTVDDFGQPAQLPQPQWLGLGPGRLCLDRSFLRGRDNAPYNGFYRRYERQRFQICRGSVLFYNLETALDQAALARLQDEGLGLFRQTGMGALWVNPVLLRTRQPQFQAVERQTPDQQAAEPEPAPAPAPPAKPECGLIGWLKAGQRAEHEDTEARRLAEVLGAELAQHYESARRYNGKPQGCRIGPSPSQWGRVRDAARETVETSDLKQTLFDGDQAICKQKDPEWTVAICLRESDEGVLNFRDWLIGVFDRNNFQTLALLARHGITLSRDFGQNRLSAATVEVIS